MARTEDSEVPGARSLWTISRWWAIALASTSALIKLILMAGTLALFVTGFGWRRWKRSDAASPSDGVAS